MRITFYLAILILCSCTQETYLTKVKNEVWSVTEIDGDFKKDQITLLETYEYDEKGIEIGHLIYSADGKLAGKELTVFDDNSNEPIGSKYYSAEDSLLSYYTLKYDDSYQRIARDGYDASNDELLRKEEYEYDAKGNMVKKRIKDAAGEIQRIYNFQYDAFGNETRLIVTDGEGNERINETFKVSKFDNDKKWLENWAWRDDKPVTYRKRELFYSE